jgi:hypothetical protein
MKRKFIVFRKKEGGVEDGGPLPQTENETGGAGNAEQSGANEQADASRGDKLANGSDAPDYYKKAHQEKQDKATKVPDIVKKQTGQNQ